MGVAVMDLLHTIVLGSYVYTTGVFLWFQRKYEMLAKNHLRHLEDRVRVLEKAAGVESPATRDSE
jgi:hypothetical protein